MKFKAFQIKNYKGINDTTLHLNGNKGSVYTLVGLNESGKTTILEAINNFRHDVDGIHAMAQKSISTDPTIGALVPKKKKDNFNEHISITAHVQMDEQEASSLAEHCESEYGFQIDISKFPLEFEVARKHIFEHSAHTESYTTWDFHPLVKKKDGQQFVRLVARNHEWQKIVREIGEKFFPRIIYFPTFLFDFPEKIQVSEGESEVEGNEYFKRMLDDALASLDGKLNLKTHIVDRVVDKNPELPFSDWYPTWMQSDERDQIVAVLAKLSRRISQEIFGRWNEILDSDFGEKELEIELSVEPGKSDERRVFLVFKVKDNNSSFKVSERSLGFRWFFCFLLFTRFFRGNEQGESIFLFDEPASNLHSRAQSKLLDSLKSISAGKNDIIYSTHSHHLIHPLWLETAFVVTNGKPTNDETVNVKFGVEQTDIHAQLYRNFVGENADKGHYFQPILDKLQVSPSLLEATREGIFVEGKSDFYILNWYKKYHNTDCNLDFFPIGGVTKASALMSLYLGLGCRFIFLIDSDEEGQKSKDRYLRDLPVLEDVFLQISEVFDTGKKEIEDLVSEKIKVVIAKKYGVSRTTKTHIQRAFSEALSGQNDLPDDHETLEDLKTLIERLRERLEAR